MLAHTPWGSGQEGGSPGRNKALDLAPCSEAGARAEGKKLSSSDQHEK